MARSLDALRPLLVLGVVVASAACDHHVQLNAPGTSPGTKYDCPARGSEAESGRPGCERSKREVPADDNRSGTAFVNLPDACKGKFTDIVIRHAESASPTVHVKCAPRAAGMVAEVYTCRSVERGADAVTLATQCRLATEDALIVDPAGGPLFVDMPPKCKRRLYRVMVHDTDTSAPAASIRCAPAEDEIPP